jgi:hypothetical protein
MFQFTYNSKSLSGSKVSANRIPLTIRNAMDEEAATAGAPPVSLCTTFSKRALRLTRRTAIF